MPNKVHSGGLLPTLLAMDGLQPSLDGTSYKSWHLVPLKQDRWLRLCELGLDEPQRETETGEPLLSHVTLEAVWIPTL